MTAKWVQGCPSQLCEAGGVGPFYPLWVPFPADVLPSELYTLWCVADSDAPSATCTLIPVHVHVNNV